MVADANEQIPSQNESVEELTLRVASEEAIKEFTQTCTSIRNTFAKEFGRTLGIYQKQPQNQSTTIHKVSLYLHDADNDIYIPKLMSIGPYHYCKSTNLGNLEDVKMKYFNDLTKRMPDIFLDTYIQLAHHHKSEAMDKYSSSIEMISHEQFVKIMVVDGCFLIEFLIKWFLNRGKYQLKQLITKLLVLKNDLLLVENQIPFFIVEELFKYFSEIEELKKIIMENNMYNSSYPSITLAEIALTFLMGDMKDALWAARIFHESGTKFDHVLHLYHSSLNLHLLKHKEKEKEKEKENSTMPCWSFFPILFVVKILKSVSLLLHPVLASCFNSDSRLNKKMHDFIEKIKMIWDKIITRLNEDNHQQRWLLSGIPNACYLRDTGFEFKKKYTTEYDFMDITHTGTEISIPILHIHEATTVNFKNLIAFEQCLLNEKNFTAYATFMSYIIVAEEDVALLKECGIINNRLGTDQKVVEFFSSLCRGIYLDQEQHYLSSLFSFVAKYYTESYYKVKFYRVRKKCIPDYFDKPCPGLCLLVSVMVIIITFTQVFFTIFRYFGPSKHS